MVFKENNIDVLYIIDYMYKCFVKFYIMFLVMVSVSNFI